MIGETGIWSIEEASQYHDFSYRLAKWIGDYLSPKERVIDWGCGKASYLRYLHDRGFTNLMGVEGVDLPNSEFGHILIADLAFPLKEKITAGNSICLEVGEHLPHQYSEQFLSTLVENTNGKLILSWAVPTQEGVGHVNCQPNSWVIEEVCRRGMKFLMEPTIAARSVIEGHYQYFRNTLLVFEKIIKEENE